MVGLVSDAASGSRFAGDNASFSVQNHGRRGGRGGRSFLSWSRPVPGLGDLYAAVCRRLAVRECGRSRDDCVGNDKTEKCAGTAPSIFAVSPSGMGMSAGGRIEAGKELDASYTVEASLVMAIVLFFLAALLQGMFLVHGRVAGRFVLQDALERCMALEKNEENMTVEKVEQQAAERLHGFFRCGNAELRLHYGESGFSGAVDTGVETEIVITEFDPEKQLRLFTAMGL